MQIGEPAAFVDCTNPSEQLSCGVDDAVTGTPSAAVSAELSAALTAATMSASATAGPVPVDDVAMVMVSCTEPPVAASEMSDASMPYRVASCCRVAASLNWLMSRSSVSSLESEAGFGFELD